MTNPRQTIVCATDLSAISRTALHTAIELATALGIEAVHILHVHEPERIETIETLSARWEMRQEALRGQAAAEAAHVRKSHPGAPEVGFVVEIRVGKAEREILRYVLDTKADVLVIGTHGRTGFVQNVLGSVAERLTRHAPCTVVVAKAPEFRSKLTELLAGQLSRD